MQNVSPKVKAAGAATVVTSFVVTLLITLVPALNDQPAVVQAITDLVGAGVVAGTALLAGYLKSAVAWATRYAKDHGVNPTP